MSINYGNFYTDDPELLDFPCGEWQFRNNEDPLVLFYRGVAPARRASWSVHSRDRVFFSNTLKESLFWIPLTEPLLKAIEKLSLRDGDLAVIRPYTRWVKGRNCEVMKGFTLENGSGRVKMKWS